MRVERVIAADPTSMALLLSETGVVSIRVATAYVAVVGVGTVRLRRHASRGTSAVVTLRSPSMRLAAEAFLRSLAEAAEARSYAA